MHLLTLLLTTLPLLTPVLASGTASVKNNCDSTLYIWSVSSSVSGPNPIAPNTTYSEALHTDPQTGGIALKITTESNGLVTGSPHVNFAYTMNNNTNPQSVYYDLSTVFGNPFPADDMIVREGGGCPPIYWNSSQTSPSSGTEACFRDYVTIELSICE